MVVYITMMSLCMSATLCIWMMTVPTLRTLKTSREGSRGNWSTSIALAGSCSQAIYMNISGGVSIGVKQHLLHFCVPLLRYILCDCAVCLFFILSCFKFYFFPSCYLIFASTFTRKVVALPTTLLLCVYMTPTALYGGHCTAAAVAVILLENERRVEGRPSPRNDHGRFGWKNRVANVYKYV